MKIVYYTPKEYNAVFGKAWGDRDAVYFVDYTDTNSAGTDKRFWRVSTLGEVKIYTEDLNDGDILCATTHCPPDDYVHFLKDGGAINVA